MRNFENAKSLVLAGVSDPKMGKLYGHIKTLFPIYLNYPSYDCVRARDFFAITLACILVIAHYFIYF